MRCSYDIVIRSIPTTLLLFYYLILFGTPVANLYLFAVVWPPSKYFKLTAYKRDADQRSIIGGSIQTTLDGHSSDFGMAEKAAAEGTHKA